MNKVNEMFIVGKIVNTHGVKGELKVMPSTDDPTRFEQLKEIYVERKNLNHMKFKVYVIIKEWFFLN